ncbi:unnamed protein product [Fraxinus pennsylvanica]|uniref:TORTIFOLIA1/SINE1-2 N-terminal domain-containing protein n=1 Tax=Fraxinus pennsylvanica TaxID=56036 RepID=A0AAD1ZYF0_9LAMI|nr:unnamed protein product [Fraxinus pennsylvanica]
MLLNCLYDVGNDSKPAVNKESLSLLAVLCAMYSDPCATHLTKIIAHIVKKLKDSDSPLPAFQKLCSRLGGGEIKGRKKKNGDVEVETGCWIKLRYIASFPWVSGRNPISSCALVHSLTKQLNFVESLKVTFEPCQILADHVRALLEQGNALACVDPNMGNYPEDEVLLVLKLALVCTS